MTETPIRNLNDEDLAKLRAALDAAVEALYVAFQNRSLSPDGPDVCTACCMPIEAKQRVATAPKQAITYDDLHEFQSAAKGEGAGQDIAYLLPRTMEFVAQGREQGAGLFSLFSTYFPPVWPTLKNAEQKAIDNFYTALTRWHLNFDADTICEFGLREIIEMCGSGGFDVDPVFSVIADPPRTPKAARTLSDMLVTEGTHSYFDVDRDRVEQLDNLLNIALSTPQVISLLEEAALQDIDEELSGLASMAHWMAESIVAERKDQDSSA